MVSEADLQLLEAYLDDALSATEVVRLDWRFSAEPKLFAALQSLRQDRAFRVAAVHGLTPTEHESDRFADQLLSSLRRRETGKKWSRASRVVSWLAASLLIGFSVGWMGRGSGRPNESGVAIPTPAHVDSHLVVHSPKVSEPGQFQVAVVDENGNVVAVQRFNKLEDARQFANDLGQYEARRQQVQEGQAMLISDRF